MAAATTTMIAAGQMVTVTGKREDIAATVKAAAAKGEYRDFQTTDGDWITVHAGAVALMAETKTRTKRKVGFA